MPPTAGPLSRRSACRWPRCSWPCKSVRSERAFCEELDYHLLLRERADRTRAQQAKPVRTTTLFRVGRRKRNPKSAKKPLRTTDGGERPRTSDVPGALPATHATLRECFVIGPIGSELAPVGSPERTTYEEALEVYEKVIEPACAQVGFRTTRADRLARPGEIPEQVFRMLRDAPLVVADLTNANPNVMYELALRHATGRPAIQIGEYARLPFDLSVIRTEQFVRTPGGLVDARKRLEEAIRAGEQEGYDELTAARVLNPRASGEAAADREVGTDAAEAPGFLEILAEMELAFPKMTASLNEVAELVGQVGELNQKTSHEMVEASQHDGSAVAKLLAARKYAAALTPVADQLEARAQTFEQRMRDVDAGVSYLLERLEAEPDLLLQAESLPENVKHWSAAVAENEPKVLELAGMFETLGGAARDLRAPTRRIADSLRRIQRAAAPVLSWDNRVAELSARRTGQPELPT